MFLWCFANVKLYLVDQKRLDCFQLVIFYSSAITICIVRLMMYSGALFQFTTWMPNSNIMINGFLYNFGFVVGVYAVILLGLYQNASMIELSIRLRNPR